MDIVEAGSWDFDQARFRIGGVKTGSRDDVERGNKYVVVEHWIDVDGKPIDAEKFEVATMCYSLFLSPVGRHIDVLAHLKPIVGKACRIVGGGSVKISRHGDAACDSYSGDFGAEPSEARKILSGLLTVPLQQSLPDFSISEVRPVPQPGYMNLYWLRYAAILQDLEQMYKHTFPNTWEEALENTLQKYRAVDKPHNKNM